MGCWFDLCIQVKYNNKWITIIRMGAKTSTGGYGMHNAAQSLYANSDIKGDYCRSEKSIDNYKDVIKVMEFAKIPMEEKYKNAYEESSEDEEAPKNEEKQADEVEENDGDEGYQTYWLHYSLEDVKKFPKHMAPYFRHIMDGMVRYDESFVLVPKWMEMAKTAFPFPHEDIFLYDNSKKAIQEKNTEIIKQQQDKLKLWKLKYKLLVSYASGSRNRMPTDIISQILSFLFPVATDVRLAWTDAESWCETIYKAKSTGNQIKVEQPIPYHMVMMMNSMFKR